MRKIVFTIGLITTIALSLCLLNATHAFAGSVTGSDGKWFSITDSFKALQDTFTPSETPYLWGNLQETGNPKQFRGWWSVNDGDHNDFNFSDTNEVFKAFTDSVFHWTAPTLPGVYNYALHFSGVGTLDHAFSITVPNAPGTAPEPISSTLFLLGGAALGIKTLRKRKK